MCQRQSNSRVSNVLKFRLLYFLTFNLGHTASTTSEDLFSDGEEQGYNKVA